LQTNRTKQKIRLFLFATLLISIISISGFAAYAMQPVNIPLEVKGPLTILNYPTNFSLYAGETINFEFTVENLASVTYFQEFYFTLNDTNYQTQYLTFSNHNYSIPPGTHILQAWLTISPKAPPSNFIITISKKINTPTLTTTPQTTNSTSLLNPSLQLLTAGVKWAAKEGKSVLYINWLDNWKTHSTTDGANWKWKSENTMNKWKNSIISALEQSDLQVTPGGDLPKDLSEFDVVVIFAYYAVEPKHEPQIKEYLNNGGGIVLIAGTPSYLSTYSKSLSCTNNLENIENWFGASSYVNAGGTSRVAFDYPFNTSLSTKEVLYTSAPNDACLSSLSKNAKPISLLDSGEVFAFIHEYGTGQVYYQTLFYCT
jgi:hypothetical protein